MRVHDNKSNTLSLYDIENDFNIAISYDLDNVA